MPQSWGPSFPTKFGKFSVANSKGAESQDKIDEMLSNLFGIDYEKYGLEMPPLFEKELSPDQIKLHDEAHFNFDYLMDILDTSGWYLKYVSIIILLFEHVANDTLETIRSPLENCLKDETFWKRNTVCPMITISRSS